MAGDGAGSYLLAWEDDRNGNYDAYGSLFQPLRAGFSANSTSCGAPLAAQFSDTATPSISQVQTEQDNHWVKTRQRNVTSAGFDVGIEQDEATTAARPSAGCPFGKPGTGSWNGHAYEAARTVDGVTDAWYQIGFSQSFSTAPRFVAALGTYDGTDNAYYVTGEII